MRTLPRFASSCARVALALAAAAAPAHAQVFPNNTPIVVPDATTVGAADPYPATITVAGLSGTITDIDVQLLGVSHSFPDDIDILLVSPNNTALILFSDVGGGTDVAGVDLTISDEAAVVLPDVGPLFTGNYRPANVGAGDTWPAPAPAPGAGVDLAVFDGSAPNGEWSLYLVDDLGSDVGRLDGAVLLVTTTGNGATAFETAGAIRVHDRWGVASSNIGVAGAPTSVQRVEVALTGLTHTNPDDLDIYLESPNGVVYGLLSDAGGGDDVAGLSIILGDDAASQPADATTLTGGTFRPVNYGSTDTPRVPGLPPYAEPAPAGNRTFNTTFADSNPNGTWTLYVNDDATANTGSLSGGWALRFTALPPRYLAYATTSAGNLVQFDTQVPGVLIADLPITGLIGGDTIVGLDFRPATQQLYALGSGSRLYRIDPATGAAVQVGSDGAWSLSGFAFGFDFNPVPDRIRVVSDLEQNFRVNPNDSALAGTDTPVAFAAGDPNFGANPDLGGVAYTNPVRGATTTTLFAIDSFNNLLVRQGGVDVPPGTPSPNTGLLFTVGPLGVNPVDADATRPNLGFDIQRTDGVDTAYAVMTTNGTVSVLYGIDLATGDASLIGPVGPAPLLLRTLTLLPGTILRDGFE